jgi:hypothetical protein
MLGLLLGVDVAWPCGGMFHSKGTLVESPAQEVIFREGDGWSEVDYRVEYEGNAADFGWVIPIPDAFVSLEEADVALFDTYRRCTQPIVRADAETAENECGCSRSRSDDKSGGAGDTRNLGVDVVAEGYAGNYEYTVLEATSTKGLLAWLDENGWSTMGADDALEAYVAAGGFQFVAIALAPTTAETPEAGRELPPVRIRYEGSDLRYPAMMGRVMMDVTEVRTRIFVEGEQRATVDGWTADEVGNLTAADGYDAVEVFDDRLRDIGGNHEGYGIVAATTCVDETLVTRFESLTAPTAHTVDATFALDGGTTGLQTWIQVASADGIDTGWLLFPLVGLAWTRRRR